MKDATIPAGEDRKFLIYLIDSARQGDALPIIIGRIVERVGNRTPDEQFELVEEIAELVRRRARAECEALGLIELLTRQRDVESRLANAGNEMSNTPVESLIKLTEAAVKEAGRIADALTGSSEMNPYTRAFHLVEAVVKDGGDDLAAIRAAAEAGYGEAMARMIVAEVRLTEAGRKLGDDMRQEGARIAIDERHLALLPKLRWRCLSVMGGFPILSVDGKRPYGSSDTIASLRRILEPDWADGMTDEAAEAERERWARDNLDAMLKLHCETLCAVELRAAGHALAVGQVWERGFFRWMLATQGIRE